MCGIVGYVGHRRAEEFLLDGLRRLEYRGYDSAGLATLGPDVRFHTAKAVGRIDELARRLAECPLPGTIGIGHTRWATHGPPSEANAHPHYGYLPVGEAARWPDGSSDVPPEMASLLSAGADERLVAVVHNGVIENYAALKQKLLAEGYCFRSATDTEVIAHLLVRSLRKLASRWEEFADGGPHGWLRAVVHDALARLRPAAPVRSSTGHSRKPTVAGQPLPRKIAETIASAARTRPSGAVCSRQEDARWHLANSRAVAHELSPRGCCGGARCGRCHGGRLATGLRQVRARGAMSGCDLALAGLELGMWAMRRRPGQGLAAVYSTVTLLARLRGLSTSQPRRIAMW